MAIATPVVVVMPFRSLDGCRHRLAALAYVREFFERQFPGWQLAIPEGASAESFHRVKLINAAIAAAPEDSVIVWSDPGSFVADPDVYREAVALAMDGDGIVLPHTRYLYLTEAATSFLLDGDDPASFGPEDCDEFGPSGGGNLQVFSRWTWSLARGLDERFPRLYGGDDAAFVIAAGAMVAPTRRIEGDVVHLWHPRLAASIPGTPEYVEQFEILAEYRDAAERGPQAVRALVESR